jgi:predicted phosphodiesterase
MPDPVRLVLISDTHGRHHFPIPPGDVLVHAGDGSSHGTLEELARWADFLRRQLHEIKIVIAGNHDRGFEQQPEQARALFEGIDYLEDDGCERAGLRFWGSPWQPAYMSWAFQLPRGQALATRWEMIPDDVDVLITHGPPHGVLDRTWDGRVVGCEALREAVTARVKPRLHVFGHIHEGYGFERLAGTLFANACTCDRTYRAVNAPLVIDVPLDRHAPAVAYEAGDTSSSRISR